MPTKRISDSIKAKLLLSSISVILLLFLLNILFIFIHITIVNQYKEVTDNLILENKFTVLIPELIGYYFNISNSPGTKSLYDKYNSKRSEIEGVIAKLDKSITNEDSKTEYKGLRNFINNIIKKSDTGVEEMSKGDTVTAYNTYQQEVLPLSPYVVEDTGNLMIKELQFAETVQQNIQRVHNLILAFVLVLFTAVTIGAVCFMIINSNEITEPLTKLSSLAKDIAGGNLELNVSKDLLEKKDETGSLSNSFNEMLNKLKTEIYLQKEANQAVMKARGELEQKNSELERFNKLMVNRELAMVELKKKVKELEEKLESKQQGDIQSIPAAKN